MLLARFLRFRVWLLRAFRLLGLTARGADLLGLDRVVWMVDLALLFVAALLVVLDALLAWVMDAGRAAVTVLRRGVAQVAERWLVLSLSVVGFWEGCNDVMFTH